jgi:beta-lactamase regulating signal transducer with metallopeptidase domain
VVTTGLLCALSTTQRRAVLEHERSHVRHRHAWWLLAADLAAAANPLLRATARTVAHTVERWADEDAADVLADRRLVAGADGRAALLTTARGPAPSPALSALGGQVPDRIRALLQPRPHRRTSYLVVLGVLLAVIAGGSALVQQRGRELFVHAAFVGKHHCRPTCPPGGTRPIRLRQNL